MDLDRAGIPGGEEHAKKLELIGKSELFSSFTGDERAFIAVNSRFASYQGGGRIFSAGVFGRELFIVSSGEVIVSRGKTGAGGGEYSDTRETELARYLPGDCFGELDMFSGALRDANAKAEGETELLVFPAGSDSFADISRVYPAESARILHRFLKSVSGRIRRVNDLVKQNSPVVQELKRQVYTDKLTSLYNQAFLKETLDKECGKAGNLFALLMFKPDNFKNLNDSCGHEAGDLALRIMSGEIAKLAGESATVFRYSGNELAILVPGAGREEALAWAERIRAFVPSIDLGTATGGLAFSFSVSVGYALFPLHASTGTELTDTVSGLPLVGRAAGGNRVVSPEDAVQGAAG